METSLSEVWSAVHRMAGVCRYSTIPVIEDKGVEALTNGQKANVSAKRFGKVHCGDNIGERGIRERNKTLNGQEHKFQPCEDNSDPVNLFFSLKGNRKRG